MQSSNIEVFNVGHSKKIYSVKEISQMMNLSVRTVYEKCRCNQIPHLRIGRRIVFPIVKFDQWFNGVSNVK